MQTFDAIIPRVKSPISHILLGPKVAPPPPPYRGMPLTPKPSPGKEIPALTSAPKDKRKICDALTCLETATLDNRLDSQLLIALVPLRSRQLWLPPLSPSCKHSTVLQSGTRGEGRLRYFLGQTDATRLYSYTHRTDRDVRIIHNLDPLFSVHECCAKSRITQISPGKHASKKRPCHTAPTRKTSSRSCTSHIPGIYLPRKV